MWSARDTRTKKIVALKIIGLGDDEGAVMRERFEREAQLTRQLRARWFPEVYDTGSDATQAYLAMELLEGENLFERLRRTGKLAPEACLTMLRGIAGGLRIAHALQIVHRDLKPGNIFFALSKDEGGEQVKVLDLGIAKDAWQDSRLTRPGTLVGSAFYMSPEQIQSGRDVDARSDLFSLAVVLYRSLTGARPFGGQPADALASILFEEPRPPSQIDPALPRELDAFFERALDKRPSHRFQSVDDMEQAFAEAVEERPRVSTTRVVGGDGATPTAAIASDEGPVEAPTVIERKLRPIVTTGAEPAVATPVDLPKFEHAPSPPAQAEDRTGRSRAAPPARRRRALFIIAMLILILAVVVLLRRFFDAT